MLAVDRSPHVLNFAGQLSATAGGANRWISGVLKAACVWGADAYGRTLGPSAQR